MNERAIETTDRPRALDRRRILRASGGLAGAAALLAAPRISRAETSTALELDMACDGRTFRLLRLNQTEPPGPPVPGDTFIVWGSLYPAKTIDAGLKGPDQPGAVGRWVCRGTFVVDVASGALPHVITTVLHVLGDGISASEGDVAAAPDGLLTEGFEGGIEEARRGIVGGYGKYAGARGEVLQTYRGDNDTQLVLTPEIKVPAPNYTFAFTLDPS